MLEKLIAEIKNGGTTSPAVLAERLNTTSAMIQAMLDTLEEYGYLQTVDTDCGTDKPCDSCQLANLCNSSSNSKPHIRVLQDNLQKS